nr:MAG TPA: hypothetical protein [Caudoviricetes sp.]
MTKQVHRTAMSGVVSVNRLVARIATLAKAGKWSKGRLHISEHSSMAELRILKRSSGAKHP